MSVNKLLQQALDALEIGIDCARDKAENIHESYKGYYPERHTQADNDVACIEAAIEALRAAIAQPEIKQQEPCGYVFRDDKLYYGSRIGSQGEYGEFAVPIYLAPGAQPVPAYVPLSDEAINDMWIDAWNVTENGWVTFEFARALERAVRGDVK